MPMSVSKKLGYSLVVAMLTLAFCELVCRLAGVGSFPAFLDREALAAQQARGVWALKFRGKNPTPGKPNGVFRIICMGDSCTFGHGIKDDDATYPAQLEQWLRQHGSRAEVINAGVVGSTVRHGYDYLRFRILWYRPDLLVVAYGWNDHTVFDAAEVVRHLVAMSSQSGRRLALIRHVRLLQVVAKCILALRLEAALSHADENARKVPLEDYANTLRRLVDLAEEKHVRVVLMTLPGAPTTDPGIRQLYGPSVVRLKWHTKYVDATRQVARRTGALLVDAAKAFESNPRRGKLIAADGIHPTAEGAKTLAALVGKTIVASDIVRKAIEPN